MAQFNSDELVTPDWLNDSFLRDVVRKAQKDPSITLCHPCKIRPGTKPGDHYASIMYRTTVHYRSERFHQEQALNLILKLMPTGGGFKKDLHKDGVLFDTEIRMYSEILPAMEKLLKDVGEKLEYARFIYAARVPNSILILEDCNPQGWHTGREMMGSVEDAWPVVRTIAKFHAASYYMNQTQSINLTNFVYTAFFTGALDGFFDSFSHFCDAVQTWDDCKLFAHKFQNLKGTSKQRLQEMLKPNPKGIGYNVLNHGDFQSKNMLHKKNSAGRITETLLVDYQCCNWGSPAFDLIGLLDMVVTNEVKQNQRNEILYEYHQHFAATLQKLGYLGRIPTLIDVHVEMLRKGFLELFHDVLFEQFKCIKLTETSVDDLMSLDTKNAIYNNEKYRSVIRAEMPKLMYRGLLD